MDYNVYPYLATRIQAGNKGGEKVYTKLFAECTFLDVKSTHRTT
jgi:hypothetical protein